MSILPKASHRGEIRRACPSLRKHIEALTAKLQQRRVLIAWPGERVQHDPDRHPRNSNCELYRRDQRRDCARRCHRGGWRRWTCIISVRATGAWLQPFGSEWSYFTSVPPLSFASVKFAGDQGSVFDLLGPAGFDSAELMISFSRKLIPVKSRNRRNRVWSN